MTGPPVLDVTIAGVPRPQGSMRIVTSASTGKPVAKYSATTVEHRNLVVAQLRAEWAGRTPLAGPVAVECEYYLPRPRHHFGSGRNSGVLRPSAPSWPVGRIDADKALRLTDDALQIAGVVGDDNQIVLVRGIKLWADDRPPCTVLRVWDLEPAVTQ